jgi:hypothetical protein
MAIETETIEWIESRYIPVPECGCWLWLGATDGEGYGYLKRRKNGKQYGIKAHRHIWEFFNGKIPIGMNALHRCDIPLCVNPNHIFLGTQTDNVRDMESKGRAVHFSGEKNGRAKLSEDQVCEIRKSKLPSRHLGRIYNVSKTQILRIRKGLSWQ